MSIKWILLLTALFLGATVAVLIVGLNPEEPPAPSAPVVHTPPPVAKPPEPAPASPPPKPEAAPPATPPPAAAPQPAPSEAEMEQSDAEIEREQVAAALAQLASPEAAQRVEGAEQLGAYPTKEAEVALTQALSTDADADVRNAAAQSLGYVEKPTDATLSALLAALEDQNEDVRLSALSTLEDFMLGSDEGSKRYKKIFSGLKAKVDSRSVPQDTREAIHDILQEQQSSTE